MVARKLLMVDVGDTQASSESYDEFNPSGRRSPPFRLFERRINQASRRTVKLRRPVERLPLLQKRQDELPLLFHCRGAAPAAPTAPPSAAEAGGIDSQDAGESVDAEIARELGLLFSSLW